MSHTTAVLQAINDQLGDVIEELKRNIDPVLVDGEKECKELRAWRVQELISEVNRGDNTGWHNNKLYYWPGLGPLPRLKRRIEDYIHECRMTDDGP